MIKYYRLDKKYETHFKESDISQYIGSSSREPICILYDIKNCDWFFDSEDIESDEQPATLGLMILRGSAIVTYYCYYTERLDEELSHSDLRNETPKQFLPYGTIATYGNLWNRLTKVPKYWMSEGTQYGSLSKLVLRGVIS